MKKLFYVLIVCGIAGIAVAQTADSESVQLSQLPAETATAVDAYQTTERNKPVLRTKKRPLSMHSGVKFSVLGANNVSSVTDFFGKKMMLDFNTLSKKMMRSGMHISALMDFDWFFQFTVLEEHTIKFSTTVDGQIWGNVSKNMLDFIANGNLGGKPVKETYKASIKIFADTGIMYQLKRPSYSFAARFAYFVPLAYMRNPEVTYSFESASGTGPTVSFKSEANIYGPLAGLAAKSKPNIAQLFKDGGLDISLYGSYQPAAWVTITGGVDYLPLMIVTMRKGVRSSLSFEGNSSTLEALNNNQSSFNPATKQEMVLADLPPIKIMRPCKLRIGADFRPLMNNYLILSPSLAIPVVNPKPFYMDGGLKIESRFVKDVLGVSFETGCIERIWRHELAFFIDSRFVTFTVAASLASHDFVRTFTSLSGAGLRLGVGIGF